MRKLGYDNPGTEQDRKVFVTNLEAKSKPELILLLKNVVECCDMDGKGYVNDFESTIRRAVGYTRGHGVDHGDECGCGRCKEEGVGLFAPRKKVAK